MDPVQLKEIVKQAVKEVLDEQKYVDIPVLYEDVPVAIPVDTVPVGE